MFNIAQVEIGGSRTVPSDRYTLDGLGIKTKIPWNPNDINSNDNTTHNNQQQHQQQQRRRGLSDADPEFLEIEVSKTAYQIARDTMRGLFVKVCKYGTQWEWGIK